MMDITIMITFFGMTGHAAAQTFGSANISCNNTLSLGPQNQLGGFPMDIDEKIEAAISLGESEQGAFMSDELADMLKDQKVAEAYYEHMSECDMCGRIWPLDQLEEPENAEVEGMYCLYCIDDA